MALGIGAVVLLPTLHVAGEMARTALPYGRYRSGFRVPLGNLLRTLVPPDLPPTSDRMNQSMAFAGTGVALLAVAGAVQRRPGAALGRSIALGTALVVLGTPLTWLAYELVPGFPHLRPLGRLLFLWCFAVALLGGLGLGALVRWVRSPSFGPLARFEGATNRLRQGSGSTRDRPCGRRGRGSRSGGGDRRAGRPLRAPAQPAVARPGR
ncbi:MAG: hypothetical protein M5U14_13735 [Acidimicrobiia bacterium]|nr:hypothetical protein [Acidimicrobiia bacterium]